MRYLSKMRVRLEVNYYETIEGLNGTRSERFIIGEGYIYPNGKYITDENAIERVYRAIEHLLREDDFNYNPIFLTHRAHCDEPLTDIQLDSNDQIISAKKTVYLTYPKNELLPT